MTDRHDADSELYEEVGPQDDAIVGAAFRWSLLAIVVLAGGIGAAVWLSQDAPETEEVVERGPIEAPPEIDDVEDARPTVRFTDVTEAAGIDFVHESGARGRKLLPETMGGGCAFLDYDGDGDADLLLLNGRPWPEDAAAAGDSARTMALYRNDGTGRFEDVTTRAGLDVPMYGMGPAIGDVDGDGDLDLFVACLGQDRLFRNEATGSGDGPVFVEATVESGLAAGDDPEGGDWSTSAGFLDADADGDLDLFVCRYVRWTAAIDLELGFSLNGRDRAYGPPKQFEGVHCMLYENDGAGRFRDVSEEAGIRIDNPATGAPMAKALAVTFADLDADGRLDIFVANDTVRNFLFRNLGGMRFEEVGVAAGVAYDAMGAATGAMGIDAADYLDRGRVGIAIGNFSNESTSFYVQQPRDPWQFADMASTEGIGSASRLALSFGLLFVDYDLDGRLDVFQANGHLEEEINEVEPSQHYEQAAQLFWNRGPDAKRCFVVVPAEETGDLATPLVGRAVASADIDGDGDPDLLVTQPGRAPRLFRNDQDTGHHWARLALRDRDGSPAIGATVEVTVDGTVRRRTVMPTRSYLAQVEPLVLLGLGEAESIDSVRVRWPDGATQTFEDVPADQGTVLVRTVPAVGAQG